jgi:hypothetical protein
MATRLRNCDETIVKGRLAKAEQFLDAVATVRDFADDEADVGDATIISRPLPRCRKSPPVGSSLGATFVPYCR